MPDIPAPTTAIFNGAARSGPVTVGRDPRFTSALGSKARPGVVSTVETDASITLSGGTGVDMLIHVRRDAVKGAMYGSTLRDNAPSAVWTLPNHANGVAGVNVPGQGGTAGFAASIVAIAESGDRAAFCALFSHFAPRVKSYLLRLGASAESAEELAQETLLIVWRRAAAFDPGRAAPSTWIFTIARNLRFDALRREKRPTKIGDPSDTAIDPVAPDAILAGLQDEARIGRALEDLPADQARVVRLAFFSDKPHSEIAAVLGLPLGTVKSRLRLAMGRLRASLGEAA